MKEEKTHSRGENSRDTIAIAVFIMALCAFLVTGYFSLKVIMRGGSFERFTAAPDWLKDIDQYGKELVERFSRGRELLAGKAPDAKDYLRRGHVAYKNRNYPEALKEYTKAVKAEPRSPEGYYWKGRALLNTGQFDPAAEDFKMAVKLKPDYSEAYDNLGWLSARRNEYDPGIGYLTRSLELKPENGWAHYNRGQLFLKKGDLDKALKDFEQACKLGFQEGCKAYDEYKNPGRSKGG